MAPGTRDVIVTSTTAGFVKPHLEIFQQALAALDEDRAFLTAGGVFSDDMIDAYIELKEEEVENLKGEMVLQSTEIKLQKPAGE